MYAVKRISTPVIGSARARVALLAVAAVFAVFAVFVPTASAQDFDAIVRSLESDGWHIEQGGEGSASGFENLADFSQRSDDEWYFVSLAGPVDPDYADSLRDEVRPTGNIVVYYVDNEGFLNVQLASGASESIEDQALAPFDDDDWVNPEEFMDDVVVEFDRLTESAGASSTTTTTTGSSGTTSASGESSGGGMGWLWIAVPVLAMGGFMFVNSRRKNKRDDERTLEMATKMRTAIQSELDELANDVLVLSGPVDLSENDEAIRHYREAAATYASISDEMPDLEKLTDVDLGELHDLGARVSHARWQMDAAEAIVAGDPIPEKPEVEPPPAPARPKGQVPPAPARIPQREARPRVPYSRTRRRSGGGLLDILIAGGSMMGRSRRRGGGMFGQTGRSGGAIFGGRSSRGRSTSSGGRAPSRRRGGGVFGGGSSSSSRSSGRRSTSRSRTRSSSRSRSRSRASSSRRSSSRRRRR